MPFEQPPVPGNAAPEKSDNEKELIEQDRARYASQTEHLAEIHNDGSTGDRTLLQRIKGENELKAKDIAHADAIEEDQARTALGEDPEDRLRARSREIDQLRQMTRSANEDWSHRRTFLDKMLGRKLKPEDVAHMEAKVEDEIRDEEVGKEGKV